MIPLPLLLDFINYPYYVHGESYDITTGTSATYITIGRSTANVDGVRVDLSVAPGYLTNEEGKQVPVIAAADIPSIFPGWLLTYKVYDNIEDYLNPPKNDATTSASYDNAIYDLTVTDYAKNINDWQFAKMDSYFKNNPSLGLSVKDSLQLGFYYKQLKAPTDTTTFRADSTFYINYTGKLLNGLVFDTTDEKTAKDNGIYSASRKYKPVPVKWAKDYTDIKLDGSTVVKGFALTISQMRAYEKGVGIFYSELGYSYSGQGKSIPGYAPLIFEIELVAKPEEN
jgi:FKBP-type peptidyl-prolyl cis-trans isomerase